MVVSGDLWHDDPDGRGARGQELALKTFSEWGVPWTTVWGNHDLLGDYQSGHDASSVKRLHARLKWKEGGLSAVPGAGSQSD